VYENVLEAYLWFVFVILSGNGLVNQIVIVIVIVNGNGVVIAVDGGDDVVGARRWIVSGALEGKAVGIAPAVEEETGSIGAAVASTVVEVEAVMLPEEGTAAAVGDSLACSLLWDMVLCDCSVAVEVGRRLDREEVPVVHTVGSAEVPGLRSC
jgi:hypothetical protein